MKAQIALLESKCIDEESLDYPDIVVLTTGQEIVCEILDESDDAVRIKTSSGIATLPMSRVESITYATETEKEPVLQAKAEMERLKQPN